MLKKVLAGIVAALAMVYLANPGAGVIELIPDNLPSIGNLDEAAITGILIAAVRQLMKRSVPEEKIKSSNT